MAQKSAGGMGMREGYEAGGSMGLFVSVYSHPRSPPSRAQPLGRVGLGGQAWAKLSSSSVLPPGTVSLCWTWTGWKVHGASRHRQAGPGLAAGQVHHLSVPPQVLRVHAGLRLLEGPELVAGQVCHAPQALVGRVDAGSVPGWWLAQEMAGVVSSTATVPVAAS